MKERRKEKKKINNRLLYTLISLGILLIIAGGVYAVDTTQAWHKANQIDFTGIEINPSKVTAPTICLGSDCRTSWPNPVVAGGNTCPEGMVAEYGYYDNGEDCDTTSLPVVIICPNQGSRQNYIAWSPAVTGGETIDNPSRYSCFGGVVKAYSTSYHYYHTKAFPLASNPCPNQGSYPLDNQAAAKAYNCAPNESRTCNLTYWGDYYSPSSNYKYAHYLTIDCKKQATIECSEN